MEELMAAKTYAETFDHGPGGWMGFINNYQGTKPLEIKDGAAVSYSPWWIDYNHAPPGGAGYLSLLFGVATSGPFTERAREDGGINRFVEGGFPTDFTNAQVTVRLRGELELRGARLHLLVQGTHDGICSGWVLTGQPLSVTKNWTEQTLRLVLDPKEWTCLGTRPDRADMYGTVPLSTILSKVNANINFILFPLTVVPMGPVEGDPNVLRPGRDYHVWQSRLPEGYVMLDTVQIQFV
jgi:hypothetical protein